MSAPIGIYNLRNGHTLTIAEQPVLISGQRVVSWEVIERDNTGELVQRLICDSEASAYNWITRIRGDVEAAVYREGAEVPGHARMCECAACIDAYIRRNI
jgi:hypothetical protein